MTHESTPTGSSPVERVVSLRNLADDVQDLYLDPSKERVRNDVMRELRRFANYEQSIAFLFDAATVARGYIAAELEWQRRQFAGYEHCSEIPACEADLKALDAALALYKQANA
ncbi:MAG: hypothetical protein JSR64_19450 [Nitrospira sp.]|nr:hypothetical protein [Nitrospira sp.]MBS0193995.1 hypothetical protein [Pseudomonadota bacterium]